MPSTGSIFTDWQQVEQDSLLFVDEDFGWSEPPQRRRRRRITEARGPSRAAGCHPSPSRPCSSTSPSRVDEQPTSLCASQARRAGRAVSRRRLRQPLRRDDGTSPTHDDSAPTAVHRRFDELRPQWADLRRSRPRLRPRRPRRPGGVRRRSAHGGDHGSWRRALHAGAAPRALRAAALSRALDVQPRPRRAVGGAAQHRAADRLHRSLSSRVSRH